MQLSWKRIGMLATGLAVLSAVFWFFAAANPPAGALGEVIRHNLAEDRDATPLFYSEQEEIYDLSESLREARRPRY